MLWKFNQVYNLDRQFADHQKAVRYEMPAPWLAPKGGSTGSRYTSTARQLLNTKDIQKTIGTSDQ
jgi:hypothetical protein